MSSPFLSLSVADANLALFEALNGLVGRSWTLDSLVALAIDNVLVKAGPIGACFFFAWYRRGGDEGRRRRILLVTLLSLFLIAPATKLWSDATLAPRPFVHSERSYVLRGGELVEMEPAAFRTVQTGEAKRRAEALREGRIGANDLGSFPSDHAAFFVALSLGILVAARAAGAIALAWTFLVVLAGRVAVGMHWPVDILAGAAVGAAMLILLQWLASRFARAPAEAAVRWTGRFPGLAAAALFLLLLEAANTMQTLKALLELAAAAAGRVA